MGPESRHRATHQTADRCGFPLIDAVACVQVKLAKKLVEQSFADKAFFCNSGTEANEAAIKFARKWARVKGAALQRCHVAVCSQHSVEGLLMTLRDAVLVAWWFDRVLLSARSKL